MASGKVYLWIAQVHELVAKIVTCLTENETLKRHCQKPHTKTSGNMYHRATEEIVGNLERFMNYWATDEIPVQNGEKII